MATPLAQEFFKGLWDEVPPFRLVLGLCPVLAVTKSVENGIGMGLATTFVLVGSNVLVSSLRKVIPPKVRIACYIVIIATFVTVVELLMQAFVYELFLKPRKIVFYLISFCRKMSDLALRGEKRDRLTAAFLVSVVPHCCINEFKAGIGPISNASLLWF